MATLDNRITRLETKASPYDGLPKTIFITFLTPGDTEADIRKLRHSFAGGDCQEWERGADESEQEFRDRASKEATRNAVGMAMLFQCG
jgi:hypothetical protein